MSKINNLPNLLSKADQLKTELDHLRQELDNSTILEALKVEFTYESNRIEGNTLTLRETQLVINEGITIGGKSLREHLEAINHKEAILFIEDIVQQQVAFSERILKQIHALVLHSIDRENAGTYRRVPVLISGSQHIPPQPYLLQPLMEEYFAFYESNKSALHPILLAAELHERLVTIHPFIDGNGRTARLIMNLILLQHGYPLAIIGGSSENRILYYDALEKVETAQDKTPFLSFIATTVLQSLERYLAILGKV